MPRPYKMIDDYRQLVEEIAQLTGAAPPGLAEDGAPVLEESALRPQEPMYLVGLIGGKDVGKSALVNALVGQEITARTSHGPGTETVIAYAHESQAAALESLLQAEVPGQYQILTHAIPHLQRQVLLDLPDIDSHWAHHVEITRRMLRHMLFPIWMQSIEKYADHRPRELLAAVAAGNAPRNFIFCLNKIDQIHQREGEPAAHELAGDYAARIGGQLGLPQPPRVWRISAIHPDRYDLPALRQLVMNQKSPESVDLSKQWAQRQQAVSVVNWIAAQDLEQRLAALQRLEQTAEEELAGRVGVSLIDSAVPRLLQDPAYRLALADELMQQRVARWPIVNVLHVLIGPLLSMLRLRLPLEQQQSLGGADALVQTHLQSLGDGQPVAGLVQSTFAYLQQSSPQVSRLYARRKLWETLPAEQACRDLRQRLVATIERQRSVIRSQFSPRGFMGAAVRLILTLGALIWFPFAQPVLEAWLTPGHGQMTLLAVQLLGVSYLLKNVAFLGIYFLLLWMILKWDTQRRVDQQLTRWRAGDNLDPSLSPAGQIVQWSNDLLAPIRMARTRMADVLRRTSELRASLTTAEAA
jgi:hypothetical protein